VPKWQSNKETIHFISSLKLNHHSCLPCLLLGLDCSGFWCEIQVVLVGGAEITTVDNLQYSYRPVPEGALHIEVRAPSNAHIALTSANHETEPMYEILLGGWENTASVIRYNRQKPDKVHNFCYNVFCWSQAKQISLLSRRTHKSSKSKSCVWFTCMSLFTVFELYWLNSHWLMRGKAPIWDWVDPWSKVETSLARGPTEQAFSLPLVTWRWK
jgi:hypothetical protein